MRVYCVLIILVICAIVGVNADCRQKCEVEIRKLCTKDDGTEWPYCFNHQKHKCDDGKGFCPKLLAKLRRLNTQISLKHFSTSPFNTETEESKTRSGGKQTPMKGIDVDFDGLFFPLF